MKNLKNGVKAGKRNIMFFQLGLNMNNFQNKTSHSFDFSYLMVAISSIRCPALAISLVWNSFSTTLKNSLVFEVFGKPSKDVQELNGS